LNFYKISVCYKGTKYFGWQIQKEQKITVQGEINLALSKLCQSEDIKTLGSSRTDAGVHAINQVFRAGLPIKLPINAITQGLNSFLPSDIRILDAEFSSRDFHPVGDATWKEYLYYFSQVQPTPFESDLFAHYSYDLDFSQMDLALKLFLGKHDFKNFQCVGTKVPTTIREIFEIELTKELRVSPWGELPLYCLRVRGDGFLKKMVRMIMGTLWSVGRGKVALSRVKDAIEMKTQERVGFVAPACGLYLHKIHF
jgi:tRNA pseudouridine38-40 synthase